MAEYGSSNGPITENSDGSLFSADGGYLGTRKGNTIYAENESYTINQYGKIVDSNNRQVGEILNGGYVNITKTNDSEQTGSSPVTLSGGASSLLSTRTKVIIIAVLASIGLIMAILELVAYLITKIEQGTLFDNFSWAGFICFMLTWGVLIVGGIVFIISKIRKKR